MLEKTLNQQESQQKIRISFLFKWLFKLFITDKVVAIYCFIFGPLFFLAMYEVILLPFKEWFYTSDSTIFIKLTLIVVVSTFSLAPLSFLVLPLFFNRIRRSTFIYKLKFFNYQRQFLATLFFISFNAMFIEVILCNIFMYSVNYSLFQDMKSSSFPLVTMNYAGAFLSMFFASLFFASFSLLLSTCIKKMLNLIFIGIICLIVYILLCGSIYPIFQLRTREEMNYISYIFPFTYINSFTQLAIFQSPKYTAVNGGIFNPFNDVEFPMYGGGNVILWHTYDIWLDWILVIVLPIGFFTASMIISIKTHTLWIID